MWVQKRNGKYRFFEEYTDYMTGKKHTVSVSLDKNTAQTRKIAIELLSKKIGTHKVEKELSLQDVYLLYLEDMDSTLKKSTRNRNNHQILKIMDILGKDTLCNNITAGYIRKKMLDANESPERMNERIIRFKAMIRWAYKNDYIRSTTCIDKLENFKTTPHKYKIKEKYLEKEELKLLLDNMDNELWILVTQFMSLSGLRFGEVAALDKKDINIVDRYIDVYKNYDYANKLVTSPKTECSVREVYIQKELLEVCKKINVIMKKQQLMYGYSANTFFFCNPTGDRIQYAAYHKYLNKISNHVLGKRITPHMLRHTHASLLFEQGVDIETISRRLGHENSRVTKEIYLHITNKIKDNDNMQIQKAKIL